MTGNTLDKKDCVTSCLHSCIIISFLKERTCFQGNNSLPNYSPCEHFLFYGRPFSEGKQNFDSASPEYVMYSSQI